MKASFFAAFSRNAAKPTENASLWRFWRIAENSPKTILQGACNVCPAFRPARWVYLDERRAGSLERRQAACPLAWPALRLLLLRRRARLWRRDLQVARTFRALQKFRQSARFRNPLYGRGT